ncbi:hypothetical protein FS837_005229 [Tulasnella sp. UAMH 9824]|nr:hypothetical protein FS837_005229 [Tulasnella sp. UAMH 9824]
MEPTSYPTISIEQPTLQLLTTPSILFPELPRTPLPPTNSVVDDIKPLWNPVFSQLYNRSRRPPWKDLVASAMKYTKITTGRTDVLEEIRTHQPWIINKSYDLTCAKCCQNPAHAEAHVLVNISYVFSSCAGFKKSRGEEWVLTGQPIELRRRRGKNAKQKDPQPPGGRKRGRPPKVPRETEIENAKKEANLKAKVASTRKNKGKAKVVEAPLENSDADDIPQADDKTALPQPADESAKATFSAHPGNIGMSTTPQFGLESLFEVPGHSHSSNINSWMPGTGLGGARLVEHPWAFPLAPPIHPMSQHSSYTKPDPAFEYPWAQQPGDLIGSMAPRHLDPGPSVDYFGHFQTDNFVGQMEPPQLGPHSIAGSSRSPWQGLPPHNAFPFASPTGTQSLRSTLEAGQPSTVTNPFMAPDLSFFNV